MHGEFLLRNITNDTLAIVHGLELGVVLDLETKEEKLCSGESEGKCRCDFSAIP
jgi:hypothetical protein